MVDWTDVHHAAATTTSLPDNGWIFWHWTHDNMHWWEHEIPVWFAMVDASRRFWEAFQPHIVQAAVALIVGVLSVGGTSVIVLAKTTEKVDALSRRLDDISAAQVSIADKLDHHQADARRLFEWVAVHDAVDRQREADLSRRIERRGGK